MNKRKHKLLQLKYIFAILITFCLGCTSDIEECESLGNLGIFHLLESSKDFIPYPEEVSKIIFSDSLGNEYVGLVSKQSINFGRTTSHGRVCPLHENIDIIYSYFREYELFYLEINELGIELEAKTSLNLNIKHNDHNITADNFELDLIQTEDDTSLSFMTLRIQNRNNFNDPIEPFNYYESYKIHNKSFEKVYSNDNHSDCDYNLFYSEEIGIIGFNSKLDSNFTFKFERFE